MLRKLLLVAAMVLLPAIAHAQGSEIDGTVRNNAGRGVPGVKVTVCNDNFTTVPGTICTTPVPLCPNLNATGCSLTYNPVTTDQGGNFQAFVGGPGRYQYTVWSPTGNIVYYTIPHLIFPCDTTVLNCGAGGGGVGTVLGTNNQIDVTGGTGPAATLSIDPLFVFPGTSTFSNSGFIVPETNIIPSAISGKDVCFGQNSLHAIECSFNNGTFYPLLMQGSPTNLFPTLNQNTTGTAANLTAAALLPNGTTATTQGPGDNTMKLATTAFVTAAIAAAGGGGGGGGTPTNAIPKYLSPTTSGPSSILDTGTQVTISDILGIVFKGLTIPGISYSLVGAGLDGTGATDSSAALQALLNSFCSSADGGGCTGTMASGQAIIGPTLWCDGKVFSIAHPVYSNVQGIRLESLSGPATAGGSFAQNGPSGCYFRTVGPKANWQWPLAGTPAISESTAASSGNFVTVQATGYPASEVYGEAVELVGSPTPSFTGGNPVVGGYDGPVIIKATSSGTFTYRSQYSNLGSVNASSCPGPGAASCYVAAFMWTLCGEDQGTGQGCNNYNWPTQNKYGTATFEIKNVGFVDCTTASGSFVTCPNSGTGTNYYAGGFIAAVDINNVSLIENVGMTFCLSGPCTALLGDQVICSAGNDCSNANGTHAAQYSQFIKFVNYSTGASLYGIQTSGIQSGIDIGTVTQISCLNNLHPVPYSIAIDLGYTSPPIVGGEHKIFGFHENDCTLGFGMYGQGVTILDGTHVELGTSSIKDCSGTSTPPNIDSAGQWALGQTSCAGYVIGTDPSFGATGDWSVSHIVGVKLIGTEELGYQPGYELGPLVGSVSANNTPGVVLDGAIWTRDTVAAGCTASANNAGYYNNGCIPYEFTDGVTSFPYITFAGQPFTSSPSLLNTAVGSICITGTGCTAAAPVIDLSTGEEQTITLTASATPTVVNLRPGHFRFIICQPHTGGSNKTWTWPATFIGGGVVGTAANDLCSVQSFDSIINSRTSTIEYLASGAMEINLAP